MTERPDAPAARPAARTLDVLLMVDVLLLVLFVVLAAIVSPWFWLGALTAVIGTAVLVARARRAPR